MKADQKILYGLTIGCATLDYLVSYQTFERIGPFFEANAVGRELMTTYGVTEGLLMSVPLEMAAIGVAMAAVEKTRFKTFKDLVPGFFTYMHTYGAVSHLEFLLQQDMGSVLEKIYAPAEPLLVYSTELVMKIWNLI